MRDKGKQKAAPPREARPGLGRKVRQRQNMEKPTQPRNQVNVCVCLFAVICWWKAAVEALIMSNYQKPKMHLNKQNYICEVQM